MSYLTRPFNNFILSGLTKMAAASGRQFHLMLKSFPSVIAQNACSVKSSNSNFGPLSTPLTACLQRMLVPISPMLKQVAGFKVKGRLKRRCKDCYFVIRQQRHYVICPTHRRHKQMSMKKRDYKSWILTDATQSKIRPF